MLITSLVDQELVLGISKLNCVSSSDVKLDKRLDMLWLAYDASDYSCEFSCLVFALTIHVSFLVIAVFSFCVSESSTNIAEMMWPLLAQDVGVWGKIHKKTNLQQRITEHCITKIQN